MLDNTAAGGIKLNEDMELEGKDACMEREAEEEACLKGRGTPVGQMTYIYVDDTHDPDTQNPGKKGVKVIEDGDFILGVKFVHPDCQFLYELELKAPENKDDGEKETPEPGDKEVQDFEQHKIPRILEDLSKNEYKPNSGLVLLLFLERHGLIKVDNFDDKIRARLTRKLPFYQWDGEVENKRTSGEGM
jgi:8-oxo-dGTP pyrophosphatase MutT (NUDIX family)